MFSILHDINEKYSTFLMELIKSLIDSTIHEPIKFKTSQRTLMFSIAL
jgi:hypothetical protein